MRLRLPPALHRANSGISSSDRPKRMAAGNISTGKTMPVMIPKEARGLEIPGNKAMRLGTIRFSAVVIPDLRSSAKARGSAVCIKRFPTGIRLPVCCRSRIRRYTSVTNVTLAPKLLPRTTQRQERTGSCPAHSVKLSNVATMEQSCSAISTAASVPIRLAPVKYPVMTPQRQLTGRKAAKSRRAPSIRVSPIQFSAIQGAKWYSKNAMLPLNKML